MKNRTIISLLDQAAIKYASDHYVSHKTESGWEHFSYLKVRDLSLKLAQALYKMGTRPKQSLAILSEGSPMWIISEYAILSLRAVSIPLSVKLLPAELPYRLNHSETTAIFVSKNNLEKVINVYNKLDEKALKIIYLNDDADFFYRSIGEAGIDRQNAFVFNELIAADYSDCANEMDALRGSIEEDDIVNISYTSGTTGDPKGIMLSHLNYYSNTHAGISAFKLRERFRTLVILPVDHCFAHTVALYGALVKGLDLYFLDTRGGATAALKNIPINLKEVQPNFLLTVPALTGNFMNKMIDGVKEKGQLIDAIFNWGLKSGVFLNGDGFIKPKGLSRSLKVWPYKLASALIFGKLKSVFGGKLEYMVGGGALLDIKQQQFFHAIGAPVYQGYGLTEASPIISSNTPFCYRMGSSGMVIPGVSCKIMNGETEETEVGKIGEIVIKGDNVMKGYYKNEAISAQTIVDGWLWTGDLGYIDADGFLVVTGRNKALLISADGEKYSPESIEEAIINTSKYIGQVILYNNQSKFTSAIVTLDPLKWNTLKAHSDLEVYELIKKDINRFKSDPYYRNHFPLKWTPSQFYIAPEPFTEANKMVNSTLKVVRYRIIERYADAINALYQPEKGQSVDALNLESIRKIRN